MESIHTLTERVIRSIMNLSRDQCVKDISDQHILDMEVSVSVLKAKIKGNNHNG